MSRLRVLCTSVNEAQLELVYDENEAATRLALTEDWTNNDRRNEKKFRHECLYVICNKKEIRRYGKLCKRKCDNCNAHIDEIADSSSCCLVMD